MHKSERRGDDKLYEVARHAQALPHLGLKRYLMFEMVRHDDQAAPNSVAPSFKSLLEVTGDTKLPFRLARGISLLLESGLLKLERNSLLGLNV